MCDKEAAAVGERQLGLVLCPLMDYLWTPWRYAYVAGIDKASGCVFCDLPKAGDDAKVGIVYRGRDCYVVLNTYPYTAGHVMRERLGPRYVPYAERPANTVFVGRFAAYLSILERAWQPYLDGQFDLEPDHALGFLRIGIGIRRATLGVPAPQQHAALPNGRQLVQAGRGKSRKRKEAEGEDGGPEVPCPKYGISHRGRGPPTG